MTDYEGRQEKILHKRISQGQKDLSRKCHCGLIRAHHTSVQANKCKREQKTETVGTIMSERQINEAEFAKV